MVSCCQTDETLHRKEEKGGGEAGDRPVAGSRWSNEAGPGRGMAGKLSAKAPHAPMVVAALQSRYMLDSLLCTLGGPDTRSSEFLCQWKPTNTIHIP